MVEMVDIGCKQMSLPRFNVISQANVSLHLHMSHVFAVDLIPSQAPLDQYPRHHHSQNLLNQLNYTDLFINK